MSISVPQLKQAIQALDKMRSGTPRYRLVQRFRLAVMADTLVGVVKWINDGKGGRCGRADCANCTDQYSN